MSDETRISDALLERAIKFYETSPDGQYDLKVVVPALRELAETRREGWVLVPVEPTGEMWSAGKHEFSIAYNRVQNAQHLDEEYALRDIAPNDIYRAMLAAVEKP